MVYFRFKLLSVLFQRAKLRNNAEIRKHFRMINEYNTLKSQGARAQLRIDN